MRRSTIPFAATLALFSAACSSGEVVVTAAIEVADATGGEGATRSQTLSDLEVQLIPFDRDAVFDSLAQVAENPEPRIPEDVLLAQDSVAAAQARYQELENRWATLRDTLTHINDAMEGLNPGEVRYRQLYQDFAGFEGQLGRVERQRDQAFQRFDSLQKAGLARANEVKIQRQNWADEAFAGVGDVWTAKVRASGLEAYADTTGADGVARFSGLKSGQYWVHARYELPFTELYWNVPVEVPGGDPVTVELTRANAQERPKL